MMKTARLIAGLLLVGLGAGCLEKPAKNPGTSSTILYRHHFLGTRQISQNTNLAQIPAILGLPVTREFSEQILQKLARSPEQLWRAFLPAVAGSSQNLVRPLLDDLAAAESFAEVHGPLHRSEGIFAIELDDQRANIWSTNLTNLFAGWKLGSANPMTLAEAKGWEIKNAQASTAIQFLRSGKWVVIGVGQDRSGMLRERLEQITKNGRPAPLLANTPFELEADFPRLADWLPGFTDFHLPHLSVIMTGRLDHVRTEARFKFSDPIPWQYEPWRFPTNMVSDPIIDFTVARGIAPLLQQIKGLNELGIKPMPNQFCAWGPSSVHADTLVTVPMPDPANFLYQIGPKLPNVTSNMLAEPVGGFTFNTNRSELLWHGWPMLLPYARALRYANDEFIVGGLFPIRLSTNRPPPELFAQLKDRTNLVYYDWEITQERLIHAEQLYQLWDIVNQRRLSDTNALDQRWLNGVGPLLTNTITEVTLSAPNELSLVRKSDGGFTGFELATLARWVVSSGFPWAFTPPPPQRHRPPGPPTNEPPAKIPAPGPK